jgi:putative ABC transport system permease protein
MGVINRGIKNAFRNSIRTISIAFILALSIAMSLVMFLALRTVQAKIISVKSSIGNIITVSPAGVRGFEGGGTLLTDQNAADISGLPHVTSVVETLSDRLEQPGATSNRPGQTNSTSNNTTNLTSPVQPGSFGNRQQQNRNEQTPRSNFTLPVMITGTNNIDSLISLNVSKLDLISGTKIDPTSSDNIAMIGKDLASKNNLTIGQTFKAYGQSITVQGIFDTGNTFSNAMVIAPIKTIQNLSGQTGQINTLIVQSDSIDSILSVTDAIKDKLGSDKVDIVSSQDSAQNAVAPLENIKTISTYSLIGSLAAGSIIIFLTMLMIVRERRREIGVLKAIGSSNVKIMAQFIVESMALTLISSIVGIILGFIFSNPVLKVLINNSTSSTGNTNNAFRGGGAIARISEGFGGAQNAIRNLQAVVGWEIIVYGFLAAILIAVIGSAIPSYLIAKIRPAEVMRAE